MLEKVSQVWVWMNFQIIFLEVLSLSNASLDFDEQLETLSFCDIGTFQCPSDYYYYYCHFFFFFFIIIIF